MMVGLYQELLVCRRNSIRYWCQILFLHIMARSYGANTDVHYSFNPLFVCGLGWLGA